MMFTRPNEHNRLLREVKRVYKLMDSTCASMTSKDDYIMFRRMNCIAENVARLMPKQYKIKKFILQTLTLAYVPHPCIKGIPEFM